MTKLFWPFWLFCISDVHKNVCLQMDLASIDLGTGRHPCGSQADAADGGALSRRESRAAGL
jgi:hypothetical protein